MARPAYIQYKEFCDGQHTIKEQKGKGKKERTEALGRLKKTDSEKGSIQEKEAKLKKLRQEQNKKRMIA